MRQVSSTAVLLFVLIFGSIGLSFVSNSENTTNSPPILDKTFMPAPLAPCNDGWHDGPSVDGVDGAIRAIAVDGAGSHYVGGLFTAAGNTLVSNIAEWNGTNWSALGTGTNGWVYGIAVSGTDIYVVGDFTAAGGVPAKNIAKWNGSNWSALGAGLPHSTLAQDVALSGNDVYVGGFWRDSEEESGGYVAKWNGANWSDLGTGFDTSVNDIEVSGSDIYASGSFTMAGGTPAKGVAKWNGVSWSALSVAPNESVNSLATAGSDIYVGGQRVSQGSTSKGYVAKWNGSGWSELGSGMTGSSGGSVNTIAVSGSDVYAGGIFSTAGGATAFGFAKWNGSGWSAVGSNGPSYVFRITSSGTDLVVSNLSDRKLAKWNGTNWSAVGPATTVSSVEALTVSGNVVYAGGYFTTDGGATFSKAAFWDGVGWTRIGTWTPGVGVDKVHSIAVSGSNIYVARTRYENGLGYVDKWDGSSWSNLASELPVAAPNGIPARMALAASGPDLYVGGDFTTIGGIAANHIAKWSGSSWSSLGTGMNWYVSALAISDTDLYAGGAFSNAGGIPANMIAKWNGTSWSALGSGPLASSALNRPTDFDVSVTDIDISGTNIYVVGGVDDDYGTGIGFVSKWNGTTWTALPISLNYRLPAVAVSGSDVYAGGGFSTAGITLANNIARWNSSKWEPLGSGTNSYVRAIAALGSDIFVGGDFTTAGCHVSAGFARYTRPSVSVSGRVVTPTGQGLRNAVVSIIDSLGVRRTANTSTLGYYSIPEIPPGPNYTIAVSSRRFRYTSRAVTIESDLTEMDFTGLE